MKIYKLILTLACCTLAGGALATADALISDATSNMGPSSDGGGSPDSSQVANVEAQAQMGNTAAQQNTVTTATQTITIRASINASGQYYCPNRKGYATPQVDSYRPQGYAQCTYQGKQN